MSEPGLAYYEFFAGGGMARAGLGDGWTCLFANDFDAHKASAYRDNWGGGHLHVGDVWKIEPSQLPGQADLAWASSPCQDLSLAGKRAGLDGQRSSAFWGFWRLMEALHAEGRAPRTLVVENVVGLASSNDSADFAALGLALTRLGYRFGAVEIDASHFLPQSRPRLFVVATLETPGALVAEGPALPFHSHRLVEAQMRLSDEAKAAWVWWRLSAPPRRNSDLASVLEPDASVTWHPRPQTERLIELLSPLHRLKLEAAQAIGERRVAAVFRRMRVVDGKKVQRAELRFDGLAGCLRTPAGGSSRQVLLVVDGASVSSRGLTAREGARLMGLADSYQLPQAVTPGLHLVGDGVAVPVVRFLAQQILEPLTGRRTPIAAE